MRIMLFLNLKLLIILTNAFQFLESNLFNFQHLFNTFKLT